MRTQQTESPQKLEYAGFGRRLCATFLDVLILFALCASLLAILSPDPWSGGGNNLPLLSSWLLSGIVAPAYFIFLLHSSWRATLGMKIMGIQVRTEHNECLGWLRAIGRYMALVLCAVGTVGLGYFAIFFTSRKQTLHDIAARTIVVRASRSSHAVATKPWPLATDTLPDATPYAGFWRRVISRMLDQAFLWLPFIPLTVINQLPQFLPETFSSGDSIFSFIEVIQGPLYMSLAALYIILMMISQYGATLGMLITGLQVRDVSGNKISIKRACVRYFSSFLGYILMAVYFYLYVGEYLSPLLTVVLFLVFILIFAFSYLMMIWTRRHQTLYDKISGTVIMKVE